MREEKIDNHDDDYDDGGDDNDDDDDNVEEEEEEKEDERGDRIISINEEYHVKNGKVGNIYAQRGKGGREKVPHESLLKDESV